MLFLQCIIYRWAIRIEYAPGEVHALSINDYFRLCSLLSVSMLPLLTFFTAFSPFCVYQPSDTSSLIVKKIPYSSSPYHLPICISPTRPVIPGRVCTHTRAEPTKPGADRQTAEFAHFSGYPTRSFYLTLQPFTHCTSAVEMDAIERGQLWAWNEYATRGVDACDRHAALAEVGRNQRTVLAGFLFFHFFYSFRSSPLHLSRDRSFHLTSRRVSVFFNYFFCPFFYLHTTPLSDCGPKLFHHRVSLRFRPSEILTILLKNLYLFRYPVSYSHIIYIFYFSAGFVDDARPMGRIDFVYLHWQKISVESIKIRAGTIK